jgi:hypothetical protein
MTKPTTGQPQRRNRILPKVKEAAVQVVAAVVPVAAAATLAAAEEAAAAVQAAALGAG